MARTHKSLIKDNMAEKQENFSEPVCTIHTNGRSVREARVCVCTTHGLRFRRCTRFPLPRKVFHLSLFYERIICFSECTIFAECFSSVPFEFKSKDLRLLYRFRKAIIYFIAILFYEILSNPIITHKLFAKSMRLFKGKFVALTHGLFWMKRISYC